MTRTECVQISWMDKHRFNSELTGTWWKRGRFSVCRKSRTWPLTPAEETGQVLSAWTQADERKSPWKPQQIETLVQARKCLCNPTLLLLTPAAHMKNWYSNSDRYRNELKQGIIQMTQPQQGTLIACFAPGARSLQSTCAEMMWESLMDATGDCRY